MIVDCYTHTWESTAQLGRCTPPDGRRQPMADRQVGPHPAGPSRHLAAAEPVDRTIVLGFKSRYLAAEIPNDQVAAYVNTHRQRLIGFAGIDPSNPQEAMAELHRAREQLSMPGVAVAPAAQDFHPSDTHAMRVYAEAARCGMPILFHTGVHVSPATKLQYAQPVLLDEIARELPDLRLVVAHMGYPWVHETIALLSKHAHVYAEISGLLNQPWQGYQALLSAYQCGVMDKLLFGSGFPSTPASFCIEALYSINHLCHGTNLPTIPREQLRGIVERDALTLLGIADQNRDSYGAVTPDHRPTEPEDDREEM